MYPLYDRVYAAKKKKRCYPEDIFVTERVGEVPIQTLLNHTSERMIHLQKDVLKTFGSKNQTLNII